MKTILSGRQLLPLPPFPKIAFFIIPLLFLISCGEVQFTTDRENPLNYTRDPSGIGPADTGTRLSGSRELDPLLDEALSVNRPVYGTAEPLNPEANRSITKARTSRKEETIYIQPTNEFPTDRENIQAAIDDLGSRGVDGTVVLRARNSEGVHTVFNFGFGPDLDFSVHIRGTSDGHSGDITIQGEKYKGQRTTIRGPYLQSFYIWDRESQITFRDLRFIENAGIASTHTSGAGHVSVSDCLFEDTFYPIALGGIEGSLKIIDNTFHNNAGAMIPSYSNAPVEIRDNTITDAFSWGIDLYNLSGPVEVTDNHIETWQSPAYPYLAGNGLMMVLAEGAPADISGNTIHCTNPNATGIVIVDTWGTQSGHEYRDNRIRMVDSEYSAVDIVTYGPLGSSTAGMEGLVFNNNRISGSGAQAFSAFHLDFYGNPPPGIRDLTFTENNIMQYVSTIADLYFGRSTRDILYCGKAGTIIDEGMNNTILQEDDCDTGT